MKRGKVLRLERDDVVARALAAITVIPVPPPGAPADAGRRPIAYRLEEANGGRDPEAPHCADWSYGGRTPTADCIGFALWASGIDRFQPGYKGSRGEWLNTDSILDDAEGAMRFCRPVMAGEKALPGDWLVSRSKYGLLTRRPGHIGIIVRPAPSPDFKHLVVDCSPRHGRSTAINTGEPWSDDCHVIRPLFYAEP